MAIRVTVVRGETPESEHAVEGVVVDARGTILAATPRPDRITFFRSSAKPFQMLPLVERGHFDALHLPARIEQESLLALIAASHNGEPMHVEGARAILAACGRTEQDLECGFQWPDHHPTVKLLREAPPEARTGIYNNCSGKHSGMIALAVAEGWPVAGYTKFDHPVQQAALDAIADVCGVERAGLPLGTDGCSAPNPALSLIAMARGYARFAAARADAAAPRDRALARIRAAMIAHPELVAGTGRFCTALMRVTGGRLVTKTGAEGVQCVGEPARGLGIVVKAVDGTRRAVAPALIGWLRALDLITAAEAEALAEFARPVLTNHRQLVVGSISAAEFPAWRDAPAPHASEATRT
jgi:L-asparaginase II